MPIFFKSSKTISSYFKSRCMTLKRSSLKMITCRKWQQRTNEMRFFFFFKVVEITIVWGFLQQFSPISSDRLILSAHYPSKQNKRYISELQFRSSWSAEQGTEKRYSNLMYHYNNEILIKKNIKKSNYNHFKIVLGCIQHQ